MYKSEFKCAALRKIIGKLWATYLPVNLFAQVISVHKNHGRSRLLR